MGAVMLYVAHFFPTNGIVLKINIHIDFVTSFVFCLCVCLFSGFFFNLFYCNFFFFQQKDTMQRNKTVISFKQISFFVYEFSTFIES